MSGDKVSDGGWFQTAHRAPETCLSCKYAARVNYVNLDESHVECRKYASGTRGREGFPTVYPGEFCWEWERAEAPLRVVEVNTMAESED